MKTKQRLYLIEERKIADKSNYQAHAYVNY